MVHIGDYIRIVSDNENYVPYRIRGKYYRVEKISRSQGRGRGEHPGYDEGMKGMALVDCAGLPFSLYEYEFEVVRRAKPRKNRRGR